MVAMKKMATSFINRTSSGCYLATQTGEDYSISTEEETKKKFHNYTPLDVFNGLAH